jgi:hypothetical protein
MVYVDRVVLRRNDASGDGFGPAWVEWTLVALLAALLVWRGLWPAWQRLNTDFPNYYLAARLYLDGYPLERLTDWAWLQRQKDHLGLDQPLVGYVPLTLFSALVVAPLAALPALAAKRIWLAVNLLLLFGTGVLLTRITRLGARRAALVVLLAIVPLRANFLFGQQHVLLLFLITLAAWAYFAGRKLGAGGILAVASALKLYPLLFALMFIRKREWRALAGLVSGAIVLGGAALALFGWEPLRSYVVEVLPRAVLRAEVIDPYSVHMSSVTGMLRRLFVFEPDLNPHPLVHAPAAFALLSSLFGAAILIGWLSLLAAGPAPPARQKLDWAITIAFLLLLSSGTTTYHFCLLILSPALAADALLETGQPRAARLVLAVFAVVCLPYYSLFPESPDGWRILLGYPRVYAIAAFCGVLWWSGRRLRRGLPSRPAAIDAAVLGVAGLALVVTGTTSQLGHLRGQLASYARRLTAPTLTVAEPAPAGGDVYFTRMDDAGYVLDRTGRGLITAGPPGVDLLHPTVTLDGRQAWLEIAGPERSRVVAFPAGRPPLSFVDLPTAAQDAEQPVVSGDGRWLGFVRRHRGRGSLWLVDLRAAPIAGSSAPAPREIVDAGYDVMELGFFPDGRIVFAGWRPGGSRLYVVDPGSPGTVELPVSGRPLRHPAVSPDGKWLAYAEREGPSWQLWVMSLPAGPRRRLTEGDCNSIEPAWFADSKTLVYSTDCGRGLGHTALARVALP